MPTELRYDLATGEAVEVEFEAAAPVVPDTVTMRQARLALLGAGLLSQVDTALNALPSPQKEAALIEWEYALDVRRDHRLILSLKSALGLTDEDLDNLFITAATL
jgi:hypothetical protein